jgi:glycosyltransferase involved in cell wall biosynthesis
MSNYHILAPFHMTGGGVWHAIDLAAKFRNSGDSAQLWSPFPMAEKFSRQYNIKQIQPYRGDFPDGGELYIVGADTEIGTWYKHGRFDKITLICNQHAARMFTNCLHGLTQGGKSPVQISYVSHALSVLTGLPGKIRPSVWNAKRYFSQAGIDHSQPLPKRENERFTVGRTSRDTIVKHHFRDPDLYISLTNSGCDVRLLGATCLSPWLKDAPNISLLPEQPQSHVPGFLLGLDCFLYRTSLSWPEAFGLVVIEAMACGLPVIVHGLCGSSDIIKHGQNGFIFEENSEAIEIIQLLKEDEKICKNIGLNAQTTIKNLYT